MTDIPNESLAAKRWARTRELLYAALEVRPADRSDWLDRECAGDGTLRLELDSLIAASEGSAFIDYPVVAPRPVRRMLIPGDTFRHYTILEILGQGGMGVVYKAVDNRLGRPVALKLLPGGSSHTDTERRRFLREARAASALNHPGIVTVYEFDTEDGIDYIAMEYIEGRSLADLLRRGETPLPVLLGYARQIAAAVSNAHAAGIVHRDLKPANVMVNGSGEVKVLDFGVARRMAPDSTPTDVTRTELTTGGMQIGTPSYMAPEQVLGDAVDHRADIFAFGVMLYQMVHGNRPFEHPTVQRTFAAILGEEPRIDGSVPSALSGLIRQCLRKKRDERLQSLREAVVVLDSLAHTRPSRMGRRAALNAAAVATVLAGGLGAYLAQKPVGPRLSVTYAIEAQHMADGKPTGDPYIASPAETFEAGWRFRVTMTSATPGYLYLINEGRDEAGAHRYWVLHPGRDVPALVGGSVTTGWFVFDRAPGTERIWFVFAEEPQEIVDGARQAGKGGRVDDDVSPKLSALLSRQDWLQATSATRMPKATELRTTRSLLLYRLDLNHR